MRMTKGCLFAVAISVAFLGSCKSKSNSKLRDIDVMPDGNEGLFVFGLQEGLVKYRMCSPEEMQKMADSKVLSGSLDTCTAKVPAWPDGNKRLDYYYPDIAEADYKTLLCKQLGYDEKDFLNTQVEFGTIERDIAQATSRLEENMQS